MKPIKSDLNEEKCPACNGTGFPPVKQPVSGRRIYPPACKTCGGEGRLITAND
jgi:DnaJ-class molecular chaperone